MPIIPALQFLNVISAVRHANRHVKESKEVKNKVNAKERREKAKRLESQKRNYGSNHLIHKYENTLKNLYQIEHYCDLIGENLVKDAGKPEAWFMQVLITAHADMRDVGHFMRRRGRSFSGHANEVYFMRKNIAEIREYAQMVQRILQVDVGNLPGWLTDKIAVIAHDMDKLGHYIVYEKRDGRRYGVPGYVYGEPGWAGNGGVQTVCSIKRRRMRNKIPGAYK